MIKLSLMERQTINKLWGLAAVAAFALLVWKFMPRTPAPAARTLRARMNERVRGHLEPRSPSSDPGLPRPRAADAPPVAPASAPAQNDSPTGNPELDEAYRNNP